MREGRTCLHNKKKRPLFTCMCSLGNGDTAVDKISSHLGADILHKQDNHQLGTFLIVQWLRLHASNAGGLCSIPDWETKIPYVVTKDDGCCN